METIQIQLKRTPATHTNKQEEAGLHNPKYGNK